MFSIGRQLLVSICNIDSFCFCISFSLSIKEWISLLEMLAEQEYLVKENQAREYLPTFLITK